MEKNMDALKELVELSSVNENSAVKAWKDEGKKIVGYWCSYVPHEVIHAAGLFPYRVKALTGKSTARADTYMNPVVNCSFARVVLNHGLAGEYHFLDGLIGINQCDHGRRAHEIWVRYGDIPFDHFIYVPHKVKGDPALELYTREIRNFKEDLEKHFNVEITDDALLNSIKVCNETRNLLRKLSALRKDKNPPIKGSEMHHIQVAAVSTPREQLNELLKKVLDEVTERERVTDHRARIIVGGWWGDDPEFLKMLEGVGGLIVADSCCFGTRDFWELVQTDGDPIESIAKAYLYRPACARMVGEFDGRLAYMMNIAKEFDADGIIYNRLKFCDLWGTEPFMMRLKEKDLGVPVSAPLEQEYVGGDMGRIRTRCEAFI